jgi:hypothetical protein
LTEQPLTGAELDAALEALGEPERLRAAERRVAQAAPQLQRILEQALRDGGWFDQAHESQLRRAAAAEQPQERLRAMRALLDEETRMGMLVGVAVGWELALELELKTNRSDEGD